MAHIAGPNAFRFSIAPGTITFGQIKVPTGKISTFAVYEKDYHGAVQNMVRLWTTGGMGLTTHEVLLDFRCLTREKLVSFVQTLLKNVGPSFSLYASAIRPSDPVQKPGGDTFVETIEIAFQEVRYATEFQEMMAPIFFRGFKTALADRVLTLSFEGTEGEVVHVARQAFEALNKATYGQTNELLWKHGNHHFRGSPSVRRDAVCAPYSRSPHYAVSPTEVTKEQAHFDKAPAGVFVDRDVWYRQDPLSILSADELAELRANKEEFLGSMKKTMDLVPTIKALWAPIYAELETRFNQGQPKNAVEAEIIGNFLCNLPEPRMDQLTQEERETLEKMAKEKEAAATT